MLLHLSQFFSLCHPQLSTIYSLRQSPHYCSCLWVMHVSSLATLFPVLYFTSSWLFCKSIFVLLNPSPLHPFPHNTLPSEKHQNALHDGILRIYYLKWNRCVLTVPGLVFLGSILPCFFYGRHENGSFSMHFNVCFFSSIKCF